MNPYDKEWEEAAVPRMYDLAGQFKVTILSGYFGAIEPFMAGWQKTIEKNKGHNTANGQDMGQFELQFTKDIMYLEYSAFPDQKPRYWTRLRDEIRMTAPGHFIGRIWMDFLGKPRFMGYFSLTQMPEIAQDEIQLIATWDQNFPALIAYVSNLWIFGEDSYIGQIDRTVEMATGPYGKNTQILSALKTNFAFWRLNILAVDAVGFYQFKLPEERIC